MPRKSIEERKEELLKKRQQITKLLTKMESREKQQSRKKDTRQKIIVGGAVLAHAKRDAAFARMLTEILHKAVTRNVDKETIAALFTIPEDQDVKADNTTLNVGTS